ncbi:MAG: chalcone isomerase family protein, partial [Flavobacteriales bacterium]|nr:chalcone isomerase family protein [Flavobacteriales bacterium]
MRILLAAIITLSMTLPMQAQVTINGVTLPASIKAGESTVNLNGGGIRKKLFFKLYVGGLYLESKNSDADKIISADAPMAVKLQITSGMISSENMSEAINEGFEKSAGSKLASLKSKIEKFVDTFKKSEIVEGNVFDIVYVPGTGVLTSK